jgi:hypothetical protein
MCQHWPECTAVSCGQGAQSVLPMSAGTATLPCASRKANSAEAVMARHIFWSVIALAGIIHRGARVLRQGCGLTPGTPRYPPSPVARPAPGRLSRSIHPPAPLPEVEAAVR